MSMMKKKPTGRQVEKTVRVRSLATAGTVRIVGGRYRRTVLRVAAREGLRPTPERVRETVFDWLGHLMGTLDGASVLDMFSGSGAFAIEAASRGAHHVVAVERSRTGAAAIAAVVERLGAVEAVQVVAADVFTFLGSCSRRFDLVFIDPPYASGLQLAAARAVLSLLEPDGIIYAERETEIRDGELAEIGLSAVRRGRAGAVHYLLARRAQLK